jgi:DNA-binding beta-propeller fold protein YncE
VISDSTNTVIANVTGGTGPNALAYDSGKGEVFVVNGVDGTVSVISDSSFK